MRPLSAYVLEALPRTWVQPAKTLVRRARGLRDLPRATTSRGRLAIGVKPLSYEWGGDRGQPMHRYYLDRFLQRHARDIHGHCLEFQDPAYVRRFGGQTVTQLDVLHIDDSNPRATLVADLTKPNDIPSAFLDCIVCTHVLHIVPELDKIVSEMHRMLKPHGVLLVAVPAVSMYEPRQRELWRFTPEGLRVLLAKAFGEAAVTVDGFGNSLTAAAEIRGLVTREFTQEELEYHDERFPVEVCARAVKSGDVG
jgi:SAM-dependent methyltransferase